jgi:hypothetical protein
LRTKSEGVESLKRAKREKLSVMILLCLNCTTVSSANRSSTAISRYHSVLHKHIAHQVHHKKIEKSLGNIYIKDLIVEMNRRRQKEREIAKMEKAFQRQGRKHNQLSTSCIDFEVRMRRQVDDES